MVAYHELSPQKLDIKARSPAHGENKENDHTTICQDNINMFGLAKGCGDGGEGGDGESHN